MRKMYRLTIDYMYEINEKVKSPGDKEYMPELLDKTQQIMDAFFLSEDELFEFVKNRLYYGFLYWNESEHNLDELIGLKDEAEFMPFLSRHLPSETLPYLLGIYQLNSDFPGTDEQEEDARGLVLDQFGKFDPVKASVEEIGPYNQLGLDKKIACTDIKNCRLIRCIIDALNQEFRCA